MNTVDHKLSSATCKKVRSKPVGQSTKLNNQDLVNHEVWLKQLQTIALHLLKGDDSSLTIPCQILIERLLENAHNIIGLPRVYTDLEIRGKFRVPIITVINQLIPIAEEETSKHLKEMRLRWEEGAETEQLIDDLFTLAVSVFHT